MGLRMQTRAGQELLRERQFGRLKSILHHAYKNVQHYREKFDSAGISPGDIREIEDLQKIPVLKKEEVFENYRELLSVKASRQDCIEVKTTGSDGRRLSVLCGKNTLGYSDALMYYAFTECGYSPFRKMADIARHEFGYRRNVVQRLGLFRKEKIDILLNSREIYLRLEGIRPQALFAFPSFLKLFASDENAAGLGIGLLFNRGETVSEGMRKELESGFGAEFYDMYGTAEFNRIAFECERHNGMHYCTDAVHIEAVDGKNNPAKKKGSLIVTGLYNYEMPLIRFEIGDFAEVSWKKCACGRTLPMLHGFEGKKDDFILRPDGKRVSPRMVNDLDYVDGIKSYRIIQRRDLSILFEYVPSREFSADSLRKIREKLVNGTGWKEMEIEFSECRSIEREASGKIRAIISHVKGKGAEWG